MRPEYENVFSYSSLKHIMKTTSKVLTGVAAGIALGIAANIFLKSKTGKKVKAGVKDITADFYQYISPRIKKIGAMGQKEYSEFMKKAAHEYGKAKKISEAAIKDLVKEAQGSWKHFSKHLGK